MQMRKTTSLGNYFSIKLNLRMYRLCISLYTDFYIYFIYVVIVLIKYMAQPTYTLLLAIDYNLKHRTTSRDH